MKELLVVAYFFPPVGGVGAQRPIKFIKYLPEYGWSARVLTIIDDPFYIHDPSLLQEISPSTQIIRANGGQGIDRLSERIARLPGIKAGIHLLRPQASGNIPGSIRKHLLRGLEIPDSHVDWCWYAYQKGLSSIRSNPVQVIYTTSAPSTSHLIGYLLHRKTGIPWIADFRDEWSQNPYIKYPTIFHKWINQKLEDLVLDSADKIIGISEPLTSLLAKGAISPEKFITITNGYDETDIEAAQKKMVTRDDGKMRFTYTGSFYGLRSPDYFLEAINQLLERGKIPPDEIRLRLIGNVGQHVMKKEEWQQVMEYPGYLGHIEALTQLLLSDVLLLFVPTQGNARTYPAKVFEYIALKKFILALVPKESVVADLIRESRTGMVVPPEDSQAIYDAILEIYGKWKAGCLKVDPDFTVIQRYTRRSLTEKFVATLDSLV